MIDSTKWRLNSKDTIEMRVSIWKKKNPFFEMREKKHVPFENGSQFNPFACIFCFDTQKK